MKGPKRGGGVGTACSLDSRLKLHPIAADSDPVAIAADLASAFGGDPAPAREILEQTLDILTRDPRPDLAVGEAARSIDGPGS